MVSIAPASADHVDAREDDGVRWLALLIRQGLLLIVAGIERRYHLISHRNVID